MKIFQSSWVLWRGQLYLRYPGTCHTRYFCTFQKQNSRERLGLNRVLSCSLPQWFLSSMTSPNRWEHSSKYFSLLWAAISFPLWWIFAQLPYLIAKKLWLLRIQESKHLLRVSLLQVSTPRQVQWGIWRWMRTLQRLRIFQKRQPQANLRQGVCCDL